MRGRVLIVAGSDSGGGAGIQADIKTVTVLGGYAATAVTALTAQNTQGVHGVELVSPAFIRQQMEVVLSDIGADVIKIGMLGDEPIMKVVSEVLDSCEIPVVLDPVMVAKGGARLIDVGAEEFLRKNLVPRATVITPNLPEAKVLTGTTGEAAAKILCDLGAGAALVKGGHVQEAEIRDVLVWEGGVEIFQNPRLETRHTHGTGCTLSSAIAVFLAQGVSLREAVEKSCAYVHEAIRTAPGFGGGHGPLNHACDLPYGILPQDTLPG